ncbi:hypothetical protein EDC01DRAFT_626159 [Geopyxis carbonaria]|nr:hypothetical protein EDC01DRAFT_626159 [Geopyxis carbonaria]
MSSHLPPANRKRPLLYQTYTQARNRQIADAFKTQQPTPDTESDGNTKPNFIVKPNINETFPSLYVPQADYEELEITIEDIEKQLPSTITTDESYVHSESKLSFGLVQTIARAIEDGKLSFESNLATETRSAIHGTAHDNISLEECEDVRIIQIEDMDDTSSYLLTEESQCREAEVLQYEREQQKIHEIQQTINDLPEGITVRNDPQKKTPTEMTDFELGLAVYCETTDITRSQYQKLLQVFSLVQTLDELKSLPATLSTIKSRLKSHLPIPSIYSKIIPVLLDKQSIGPRTKKRNKNRKRKFSDGQDLENIDDKVHDSASGLRSLSELYFINPADMIKCSDIPNCTLLSQDRNRLHFGLAALVDEPSELWHGEAWAESVRTCSGISAKYSTDENEPIIPSDFVIYGFDNIPQIGRIQRIYRDERKLSPYYGKLVAVIQQCVKAHQLQGLLLDPEPLQNEVFLLERAENHELIVPTTAIHCRIAQVLYDRQHKTALEIANEQAELDDLQDDLRRKEEVKQKRKNKASQGPGTMGPPPSTLKTRSRNNAQIQRHDILIEHHDRTDYADFKLAHPILAELEIEIYGRDFLVSLSKRPVLSMPHMTFIDAFGLYRNVYCSLTGIYMIISAQNLRDRTRRNNIIPLTLGPHGSDLRDVMTALGPFMRKLEVGVEIMLDSQYLVIAPALGFLGDMPQQAENMGFLRQNATFGCRTCLIPSEHYSNMEFDILTKGRYHYQTQSLRKEALTMQSKKARETILQASGMKDGEAAPIHIIAPALDVIRSAPSDPPHADCQGIGRMSQTLLILYALLPKYQTEYANAMCKIVHPPGWPKIQNPIRHRLSWDLAEQSRALLLTAITLRVWLNDTKLRKPFITALMLEYRTEIALSDYKLTAHEVLIQMFYCFAKTYGLVSTPRLTKAQNDSLEVEVIKSRKTFIRLVNVVCHSRRRNKDDTHNNSVTSTQITVPGSSIAGSVAEELNNPNNNIDPDPEVPLESPEAAKKRINENAQVLKLAQLEKWACRANVHIGCHYNLFRKHYATLFNVFVLMGEGKHLDFKNMVSHTNTIDVVLQLFRKDLNLRTLRSCPDLMQPLLPYTSRKPLSEDHLHRDNLEETQVMSTDIHRNPAVFGKLLNLYVTCQLGLPLRASQMSSHLTEVLERDYDMPNMYVFGGTTVKYWSRCRYDDSTLQKTLGFARGSNVLIVNALGTPKPVQVQEIFTITLPDNLTRVILIVNQYHFLATKDNIVDMELLKLGDSTVSEFYGLSRVCSQRPYIIPTNSMDVHPHIKSSDDIYWYCSISINYM